jgi:hypothetical protein
MQSIKYQRKNTMNPEISSSPKPEKNQNLKEAVNTLKFFNHRVREELKNRPKKSVPTSAQ